MNNCILLKKLQFTKINLKIYLTPLKNIQLKTKFKDFFRYFK